ncbi:MAG: hypothetical protein V2J11_10580, partial [Desulfofustis sp.]|nr:hypothetical protein [Desulfofustis sp.]
MGDTRERTIALNRIEGKHSHRCRPDARCTKRKPDEESASGEIITELTHGLKDRQRTMVGQAVPS